MKNNSIIVLIDMDCFYVQVELKEAPEYIGKETAVVQYNSWRGGSIIAVSYEARAAGVNRSLKGDKAQQQCPNLHLFRVPELRGKADLRKYRSAGAEVIKCLTKHASRIERASIDEAYIDLTDEVDNLLIASPDSEIMNKFWEKSNHSSAGCHVVGYNSYNDWLDHIFKMRSAGELCDDIRLALGAFLVQQIRDDIYDTLGYRCSAGIGHSKMVAKYSCGVNKPNQQTITPLEKVQDLLVNAPIEKIRNLGGKTGFYVQEQLKISTMGELGQFSIDELSEKFGEKTGPWLFYLCRGQDDESVLSRQLAQSIGCSKMFPGSTQLNTIHQVQHWLTQMAEEIAERIEEDCTTNARLPTHMCVSYRQLRAGNGTNSHRSLSGSRVVQLNGFSAQSISSAAFVVLSGINNASHHNLDDGTWSLFCVINNRFSSDILGFRFPPLISLGLSAGKFRNQKSSNDISRYLIDAPVTRLVEKENAPQVVNEASSTRDTVKMEEENAMSVTETVPTQSVQDDIKPSIIAQPQEKTISISDQPIVKKKAKGFFARLQEQNAISQLEWNQPVSLCHIAKVDRIQWKTGPIVPKESIEENHTDLRRGGEESFVGDLIEKEEWNESNSSCLTSFTNEDYFNCEVCGKNVLMWDAPEHNDWHVAKNLQKQITKEINDQMVTRSTPTARSAIGNCKKKERKTKGILAQSKNQLTLDKFFSK